jgi:D-tyrosyl-tRNA(Tyr) deacylase
VPGLQRAPELVAELRLTLADWEDAEAQREALAHSVERSVARVQAEVRQQREGLATQTQLHTLAQGAL